MVKVCVESACAREPRAVGEQRQKGWARAHGHRPRAHGLGEVRSLRYEGTAASSRCASVQTFALRSTIRRSIATCASPIFWASLQTAQLATGPETLSVTRVKCSTVTATGRRYLPTVRLPHRRAQGSTSGAGSMRRYPRRCYMLSANSIEKVLTKMPWLYGSLRSLFMYSAIVLDTRTSFSS